MVYQSGYGKAKASKPFSKAARTPQGGFAKTSGTPPSRSSSVKIVSTPKYDKVIISDDKSTRVVYAPAGELPESESGYSLSPKQAQYLTSFVQRNAKVPLSKSAAPVFTPESFYASRHSYDTDRQLKPITSGHAIKGYEDPYAKKSVAFSPRETVTQAELRRVSREYRAGEIMRTQRVQDQMRKDLDTGRTSQTFNVGNITLKAGSIKEYSSLLPSVLASQDTTKSKTQFDPLNALGAKRYASAYVSYEGNKTVLRAGEDVYRMPVVVHRPFSRIGTKPLVNTTYKLTPQDVWTVRNVPRLAGAYAVGGLFGAGSTYVSSISAKAATSADIFGKVLVSSYILKAGSETIVPIYSGVKTKNISKVERGLENLGTEVATLTAVKAGAKKGGELVLRAGYEPYPSYAYRLKYSKVTLEPTLKGDEYSPMFTSKTVARSIGLFKPSTGKSVELISVGSGYRGKVTKISSIGSNVIERKVGYFEQRKLPFSVPREPARLYLADTKIDIPTKGKLFNMKLRFQEATPKVNFKYYPDTTFSLDTMATPLARKVALRSSSWIEKPSGIIGGKQQFKLLLDIERGVPKSPTEVKRPLEMVESFKTKRGFIDYVENLGTKFKTLEFGARGKAASIGTLRVNSDGKLLISPEAHRVKDIGDYFTLKSEQINRMITGKKKWQLKLDTLKSMYPKEATVSDIVKVKPSDVAYVEYVNLKNPFKGIKTFALKAGAKNYGFVAYKTQIRGQTRISGDIDTDLIRSADFAKRFAETTALRLKTKYGEPTFWKEDQPFLIQTTHAGRSHLGDIHPRFGAESYAQAPESLYGMPYDVRSVTVKKIKILHMRKPSPDLLTVKTPTVSTKSPTVREPKSPLPKIDYKPSGYAVALNAPTVYKRIKGIGKLPSVKASSSGYASASFAGISRGSSSVMQRSVSTSLSKSASISPSLSISPSRSLSKSISRSVSFSPSRSFSPSISTSVRPSFSFSPSISPSLSVSPSPSPSPSNSISTSTTPKKGIFGRMPETKQQKKSSKRSKFRELDWNPIYTPSIAASVFKIYGKAPKVVTGAELRPIRL